MSTNFEDYGLSVSDVQALMSATLNVAILFGFCYGVHTCIFLVALYHTIQSAHSDQKRTTFVAIITFLWCANGVIMISMWSTLNEAFITHGISLETKFIYLSFESHSGSLIIEVFRALSVFLADLILIWRCWVLYGGDLRIVALPSLCLLTETVGAGLLLFYSIESQDVGAAQAVWTLVYYAMTMATNSLCTFLILFRHMRFSGINTSMKTFRRIIEVFVESAAMYAGIYIVLLVIFTYDFYSSNLRVVTAAVYPQVISYSITGIAPTLIIARVMAGQSHPKKAPTPSTLPDMRSTMHSIPESMRFASTSSHGTRTGLTSNIDLEQSREVADDGHAEGGHRRCLEAPTLLEKRSRVTFAEGTV